MLVGKPLTQLSLLLDVDGQDGMGLQLAELEFNGFYLFQKTSAEALTVFNIHSYQIVVEGW